MLHGRGWRWWWRGRVAFMHPPSPLFRPSWPHHNQSISQLSHYQHWSNLHHHFHFQVANVVKTKVCTSDVVVAPLCLELLFHLDTIICCIISRSLWCLPPFPLHAQYKDSVPWHRLCFFIVLTNHKVFPIGILHSQKSEPIETPPRKWQECKYFVNYQRRSLWKWQWLRSLKFWSRFAPPTKC